MRPGTPDKVFVSYWSEDGQPDQPLPPAPERPSSLEGVTGLDPDAPATGGSCWGEDDDVVVQPVEHQVSPPRHPKAVEEGMFAAPPAQRGVCPLLADPAVSTLPKTGSSRGGRRGGAPRGRGKGSAESADELGHQLAAERRRYTDEEERLLIDCMGLKEWKARFHNRTEKQEKVWVELTAFFNAEMSKRYPGYQGRYVSHLKNKWDNGMLRPAKRHKLFLSKNNGTTGGSGRDVLEDRKAPKYFEELQDGGHDVAIAPATVVEA